MYFSEAVFPHMRGRGGRIINFGSYWGLVGYEGSADYCAAKAAIRGLSRTATREWGKHGITLNVICPAAESPALAVKATQFPELYEERPRTIPLRRYGHPEHDVGRIAVFLAGPDASFITGMTMMADGGLGMYA